MNTPTRPLHFSGPRLGILARNDSRPSESVARSATSSGGIMDEIVRNLQGNHRWDQQTQEKFQAMVAQQEMLGGAPPSGLEIRMEDKRLHISMGKFNDGIVAATPPAVTTFGFSNDPSGVEVVATETMESYLTKQGDLIAVLRDSERATPLLQVRYRSLGKHAGWKLDIDHPAFDQVLPAEANLYELNLGLWAMYLALRMSTEKMSNSNEKEGAKLQAEDPMCVNHDLECSFLGGQTYTHIKVEFLWCTFYVEIVDCCLQHDVDMWCGVNVNSIEYIPWNGTIVSEIAKVTSARLLGCIFAKALKGITLDMPWYCGGAITGAILGIIAATLFSLGFYTVTYFIALGMAGGERFPLDGRHDDSCLCGGNRHTIHCGDNCRNLCLEAGKPQDCYMCYWDCRYEKGQKIGQGKLLGTHFFTDPDGKKLCCPETDTKSKCQKKEEDVMKTCSNCYPCEWECIIANGRQKRVFRQENEFNLPCCPETIVPENELGDWCKEKSKTKGVV